MNGNLHLTPHQYRTSPTASKEEDYATQNLDSFCSDCLPITAAAGSAAFAAGTSKLVFSDADNYEPFEGAGSILSQRFDIPEVQEFDHESISGVLLRTRNGSMEGGVTLRGVASQAVGKLFKVTEEKDRDEGLGALLDSKTTFRAIGARFNHSSHQAQSPLL